MSFTTIKDEKTRRHIFWNIDPEHKFNSWSLLHGDMAWDLSVIPQYVEWWWRRINKKEKRTYTVMLLKDMKDSLYEFGVSFRIDGQNAELWIDAVEDLSKAEKLLVKSHCLRRAGRIFSATQVDEAAPGLPIFKVTMIGRCDVGYSYPISALWKDVYLPGRLDVMKVLDGTTPIENIHYRRFSWSCQRETTYCKPIDVYARKTIRKAVNFALKEIAPHLARFDEVLAKDAAKKRQRLAMISAPAQPVEFADDDDLVGL